MVRVLLTIVKWSSRATPMPAFNIRGSLIYRAVFRLGLGGGGEFTTTYNKRGGA